ncbi:MAG: transglycosylase SLT domain-containing protein [Elusimicrobia bacterium]|nr:transglycosylase SLT domain-containing protein [Elusimicrobiota bacterium]
MISRASLSAVAVLCAVPALAVTLELEPADPALPPARPFLMLDALRAAGTSPAAVGRVFDAALRHRDPYAVAVPETPSPAYARTFRRLARERTTNAYDAAISTHAARRALDPRLVKAIVAAESEFSARAKSPAGALGLMQVMPRTAEGLGVSRRALLDPESNIRAGTAYLAELFASAWRRYRLSGSDYARAPEWLVRRVIAAYHAGPRFLAFRPMYRQTRDYVRRVLLFYRSEVAGLTVPGEPG